MKIKEVGAANDDGTNDRGSIPGSSKMFSLLQKST